MSDEKHVQEMTARDLLRLFEADGPVEPGKRAQQAVDGMCAQLELESRGMVIAADVAIAWCDDKFGKVEAVSVEHRRRLAGLRGADNLRGAEVDGDWLKAPTETPEAVFLSMAQAGFADRAELVSALEAFGKIIQCGWARQLHPAGARLLELDFGLAASDELAGQ